MELNGEAHDEYVMRKMICQARSISDITDEEALADYNLWLAREGYIADNEYARAQYEEWKMQKCGLY